MKKPPGRPPKRTPLSEEELTFLTHLRTVDDTGSGLPLPKTPDRLGSLIDLLFIDLEARNQKLAALLEVDTEALHLNPKSLRLSEALRLIARLLWIIIESHDKRRAAELKFLLRHEAALEHQNHATKRRGRKMTHATAISGRAFEDRFSTLVFGEIRGDHDIPEMKRQCEIVHSYIDANRPPRRTLNEHVAPSVFQKWMNKEWPTLRDRLIGVKCLCDYPPQSAGPPTLPPVKTTSPIPRDKNPDLDSDPTEITRGTKYKKDFGYTPHEITCIVLGHMHGLKPNYVEKLLKTSKT